MKKSDFSKKSETHAAAPVQRTAYHQHGTGSNAMVSAYSKHILQLQRMVGNQAAMLLFDGNGARNPVTQRAVEDNKTGMPNELKSGLESMSGYDLSDVKVHHNSDKPAKLQAHAYAQGNDIHVGPGQEKYLPHEGWHIVQQRQGRVQPTLQLQGMAINNDPSLEKEADVMGSKAYDRGSRAGEGNESRITNASLASPVLQGEFGMGKESNVPVKRNTTIRDKAMQLLSRSNTDIAITTTRHVIQRALTLDNADFSGVNNIRKLGGAADGAYLVEDDSGKIVVKVVAKVDNTEGIDSTVMSYNLAKDFGVKIPSARYLKLDTEEGEAFIDKANSYPDIDLAKKLKGANAITLWEYIPGKILEEFKGRALEDEEVKKFRENTENFVNLGKMLVFDAAILNGDRFKVESDQEANPGNLMIADNQPVGLDQDFAHIDNLFSPGETLSLNDKDDYGHMFVTKLKPLLSNPAELAQKLVAKMVKERYVFFSGMDRHITEGIQLGIETLKVLANKDNLRVETLINWSKTFKPETDLETDKVKAYWNSLIG
ncbi:eCIS core domain-containing protein [Paenibacillus endoradicis]|uniref:eCIS core domain-containing protein n=1 Tax=Paenibacillus endoradicis TaxID=2972487 RepID=UPI002158F7AA|nr:DUF4157 domain-containing protein [Paenibacillus endoradicis]MCR8656574.1 DUF4157 domain-containing protein [Paenibacillus endoradicis]